MSLNDDTYERQPERVHICTNPNSCVSGMTFRLVVWKGSAELTELRRQRFCSMQMRDDFLLLFPKMPQVRSMLYMCSDLACVYNSYRVAAYGGR